ncbi:MAG: hypothetical protein U5L96_04535 [Owenweeksia sp.]|nr:hypothetical protein [Owenweeksia sp.]
MFNRYNGLAEMEQNHLVQNPHLAVFLKKARPVFEKPLVISQIIFGAKPVVHQHMLMCGDAAGLIHPLCGNGMAMAIHGAQLCSMVVSDFQHRITRQQMEDRYRHYWQHEFNQRLWFGMRAEQMLSRNSLTEWAVAAGNAFPAFLKRVVRFSHGSPVY